MPAMQRTGLLLAASTVLMGLGQPAFADATVVTEVVREVNGTAKGAPQIFRVEVKGKQARRENPDGTITIYDREAGKVFTLQPRDKTYFVQSPKDALEAFQMPDQMKERFSLNTSLKLQSDKETGQPTGGAKEAAEVAVAAFGVSPGGTNKENAPTRSTISGEFKIQPKAMGGFPGGGFPGGGGGGFPGGGAPRAGGFPGGGGPSGGGFPGGGGPSGSGGRMPDLPRGTVSGEVVTTSAADLLGTSEKDARDLAFLLTTQVMGDGNPFQKSLQDQMSRKKAAPVYLRLTTVVSGMAKPGGQGDVPQGDGPPAPPDGASGKLSALETVTMRLVKVDKEPVKAAFTIPSDYTRIDKPTAAAIQMPTLPQGGGPGGNRP